MAELTPHQKIKRACLNGTGVTLSAIECHALYFRDIAIKTVADADDGWEGQANMLNYAAQRRRYGEKKCQP